MEGRGGYFRAYVVRNEKYMQAGYRDDGARYVGCPNGEKEPYPDAEMR